MKPEGETRGRVDESSFRNEDAMLGKVGMEATEAEEIWLLMVPVSQNWSIWVGNYTQSRTDLQHQCSL